MRLRCDRPGCRIRFFVKDRDYNPSRPWFCSSRCFRLVRQFVTEADQSRLAQPDLEMYSLWEAWKDEVLGLDLLADLPRGDLEAANLARRAHR